MISFDYSDKTVLVTGAGRGLGFAIASAFHAAGATVFVNDRTPEMVPAAIAKLGGGDRLIAAPADLASAAGRPQARCAGACTRSLDILVNNAAVNIERAIEETSDDLWNDPSRRQSQGAVLHGAGGACHCSRNRKAR